VVVALDFSFSLVESGVVGFKACLHEDGGAFVILLVQFHGISKSGSLLCNIRCLIRRVGEG